MKNTLFALVLAGSQSVSAQPNPTQIIDISKIPLCSGVQRKVEATLDDERIVSKLVQYIPNLGTAPFKDDVVKLFRLASETNYMNCRILPKDFPLIVRSHFLLITSIAWGVGDDTFYRAIIEVNKGTGVEIASPLR